MEYLQQKKAQQISLDVSISKPTTSASIASASTETESSQSDIFFFEPDKELLEVLSFPDESSNATKRILEDRTEDYVNKRSSTDSPKNKSLEQLFRSTPEGQIILANRAKLNNDLRSKIAKIVVRSLLDCSEGQSRIEINTLQFVRAAKEIAELFPGESEHTYYIPYSSSKKGLRRQPARGKLWSRYINLKAALRLVNAANADVEQENVPSTSNTSYDEEEKIAFLKVAVEPFDKILSYWEDTYLIRQRKCKSYELEDIYKEFPCLSLHYGITLLESDFNHSNEEKIDIIYSEWPKIAQAIIIEAKERQLILKEDVIKDVNSKALLVLPYLFSPVTIRNSKKRGIWRPSRSEVQESFLFNVQEFAEASSIVERRKQKLHSYDLPLQPFGVIVGDDCQDVRAFYVFINGNKYTCESGIRCLELLYKSFHALNLEYPSESKHVWYFVQELVFKTSVSNKVGSTSSVISDINFHLNNLH
ncbi:hypothetical protein PPYR_01501 [Photinus pyralis]|nr:hypothetical protein PPYR_15703 [Photinus pyralis]KAB0804531.1 hypothetical protein PPYR_01501 [Photinus pyralis]